MALQKTDTDEYGQVLTDAYHKIVDIHINDGGTATLVVKTYLTKAASGPTKRSYKSRSYTNMPVNKASSNNIHTDGYTHLKTLKDTQDLDDFDGATDV